MKNEKLIKQIAFGMTLVAMLAGTIVFTIAVLTGSIDFSEWHLPGNVFDCPVVVGAFIGVVAFIVSVPVYIKLFLEPKSAGDTATDNNDNGNTMRFVCQIAGLVITPIVLFTVLYYVVWLVIAVVAFTLPYLLLAVLAVGAGLILWMGWTQMDATKTTHYVLAAILVTAIYCAVTWFVSFDILGNNDTPAPTETAIEVAGDTNAD